MSRDGEFPRPAPARKPRSPRRSKYRKISRLGSRMNRGGRGCARYNQLHRMISRPGASLLASAFFCVRFVAAFHPARPLSLSHHHRFFHATWPSLMPRGVKKENLPSKDCVVCGRPFTWRKKVCVTAGSLTAKATSTAFQPARLRTLTLLNCFYCLARFASRCTHGER